MKCDPLGHCCRGGTGGEIFTPLRRSALVITDTELRLIARAAIMGESNQPVNGNNTPAAKGTPKAL
jgi:hypothetical protein